MHTLTHTLLCLAADMSAAAVSDSSYVCCVTQQTCLLSHVDSWAPVDSPRRVNRGHILGNVRLFGTMKNEKLTLDACGSGLFGAPSGPLWAGRELFGPWTLVSQAVMGPTGPLWAGHL